MLDAPHREQACAHAAARQRHCYIVIEERTREGGARQHAMQTAMGLLHAGRTGHHLARTVGVLGAPLRRGSIALISSILPQRPLHLRRFA